MGCHPKKVLARSIPPVRDVWGFSLSEPFPEWVAIALPTGSIFFSEPLVGHPFTALHWADWFANTNSTWSWICSVGIDIVYSRWAFFLDFGVPAPQKTWVFCACSALIWVHHLTRLLQCA
jgi:hypothetical protein